MTSFYLKNNSVQKTIRLSFTLSLVFMLFACASGKHTQPDLQEPAKNETPARPQAPAAEQQAAQDAIPGFDNLEEEPVADPLEPWNRAMFTFNDKVYFWAMKPVIKGYNWVVPEVARKSIHNFFVNIEMPSRFISSLLQLQLKAAGVELARFAINSTIGIAGLFDVAMSTFKLERQIKDLGQTLGKYGIGEGFYIIWPFLGPSSARDTIGIAGEIYLSPWAHVNPAAAAAGIGGFGYFNKASLESNEYEELVSTAVEPYSALKNAFIQYRRDIVKNK